MDILSLKTGSGNLFRKPELNWGVIGTARIAEQTIPSINATRNNRVVAVASRDLTRARQFADSLEVPVAYGSYEELLLDATVQAVYIPLTNEEHKPWTIKALQAGKHVLVEKPIALNAEEAREMVGVSVDKSLVLMESFNYRYHSRIQKVLETIRKDELGRLRFLHCSFSFLMNNPDDFRLVPAKGGGALYDLGCYCVDFQRLVVGREPQAVQARYYEGGSGVDLQMQVSLDFGNQIYGSFDVAFNAILQNVARILGTDGVMTLEWPFSAKGKNVTTIIERGDDVQRINYRAEDTSQRLIEHFYQVVMKKEVPLYPLAESVNNMAVIDAIFQSAVEDGKLVQL
ncbi:MAG: Gfo/Idh/MocA family oxidoreductase [Anaerolineaceae bacterium]|jgi:predicted dehydrogenase|nr:Gfo/Idh/MocA family oxidoreductase [Anaerolineaceae bacterium]